MRTATEEGAWMSAPSLIRRTGVTYFRLAFRMWCLRAWETRTS